MTSSTIRSCPPDPAMVMAWAPVQATSVANPSKSRAAARTSVMKGSSSTMRMRPEPGTGPFSPTGRPLFPAEDVQEALNPPPGHQAECLHHDERRHLRYAFCPVDEPYGDLHNRGTGPFGLIGHLDLEPVPFGPNVIEGDPVEHGSGIGAESGGGVGDSQPEKSGGVHIPSPGQEAPVPRPIGDRPPGYVSRTDDQLETLAERSHQVGKGIRVMGKVGIHLYADIEPAVQAPPETGTIRTPETGLLGSPHDFDVADLRSHLLGYIPRPVRTAVINHQHGGIGKRPTDSPEHPVDVLGFVIGGDDNQDLHGRRLRDRPVITVLTVFRTLVPTDARACEGSGYGRNRSE